MQGIATFKSNRRTVNAELFTPPTGIANGGAVVVAYGSDGMTEPWGSQIRAYAEALSGKGFVAIIPDYFASTGTTPGLSTVFQEIAENRDTWQQVHADCVDYVKTNQAGVDKARVGLLGFSLGGHLCVRLRSVAKVLVEFFAPELPELGDLGTPTVVTTHAQIHHGKGDDVVPYIPNAEDIKALLQKEILSLQVFPYDGAGHGFIGEDSNNKNARTESMERTLSCFETHL
jgi:dienelactone hydrolase